jgi:hypothetical protein
MAEIESNSVFIARKFPVWKAVIDYIFRRLETLIIVGVVALAEHWHETNDVKWIGQHLDTKEKQIEQLQRHDTNTTEKVQQILENKAK